MEDTQQTRCGYVTLVGRPNVGKSTLLNAMLGEKLAITSAKPQTTRNRIPGILTRRGTTQLVFLDTPGLHHADGPFHDYMNEVARDAVGETDVVGLMVDTGMSREGEVGVSPLIEGVLSQLRGRAVPVVLILNKVDRLEKTQLLPIIERWAAKFPFADIVPVSALGGDGVEGLVDVFERLVPEGPLLYPADALTDLPERFIAAEIIREQVFSRLKKELPYSTAVVIESWTEKSSQGRVDIQAVIAVERDSQKGIIIGKQGSMLRSIGQAARHELQTLLGTRVVLKLFVKVEKGWTRSSTQLKKFGYQK
ncbi:MAG: GTPase Era [Myxococcota bacterium]|nr:GTPase Era [Myxococcota bacterium]